MEDFINEEAKKEAEHFFCGDIEVKLQETIESIYIRGFQDGVTMAPILREKFEQKITEAEAIAKAVTEQAAADQPEAETAEPAAQEVETFNPLDFIHAGNGQPQTLCGVPIDHSIEVFQIDDPNAGRVNCPRCLEVLQKVAAEN